MSLEEETVVVVTTKLPEVPKGTTLNFHHIYLCLLPPVSAFSSLCAAAERLPLIFVCVFSLFFRGVFVALAMGGGGGPRPATQAAAPVSSDVVKEAYRKRAESRRRQDANMSDKDRANMSRMLKQVRPPTPCETCLGLSLITP
jgi:hypothetical protein